jgi:hypothetical protein
MKKQLLTLLFLLGTFFSYGQETIKINKTNTVSKVGDTIKLKVEYSGTAGTAKLTQFDFQYNNKLLSLQSRNWIVSSNSAQKAYNSWNGYKWGNNTATSDIDGQYADFVAGSTIYGSNADFSVERITIQDVTAFADGDGWMEYNFIIKDKAGTNYSDYSNLLSMNWGYLKKDDGTEIAVEGKVDNGTGLSLTGITGGDAGNVTLKIFSKAIDNSLIDGTDYTYYVYNKSDIGAGNQVNEGATHVKTGNYDASGEATVSGLENDKEYFVWNFVDGSKDYMDNVVTVSDLALVFAEAIGAGSSPNNSSTTFDYHIQTFLANVIHDSPFDGVINFSDSYEILAYLQGVTSGNSNYISKKGGAVQSGGTKSIFGTVDENGSYLANLDATFKPTDSNKSFEFAHVLIGDVNFSHSYQPANTNDFKISSMNISNSAPLASSARYTPIQQNVDLTSQIVDGEVIFSINSEVTGMIGTQFNIVYDDTRLELKNVVFDTGNEMTNFANHIEEEGKVNIGSFDQQFEQTVKTGTPYQLIFTPLVELSNTSGLISFKVNEGVKADGTQIKLNME